MTHKPTADVPRGVIASRPLRMLDPKCEVLLDRLYAEDRSQFARIVWHYLPRLVAARLFARGLRHSKADDAFMQDKLVALDRDKATLAYMFCRALNARNVVEVGSSLGVSTIYLAAAVRDNVGASGGSGSVVGTEIEPAKVRRAREHLEACGLSAYAEIREGDALVTLREVAKPVDFVLIDTWIPLALPALKLLQPWLRPGAIVLCDNVSSFAREYAEYTGYVRDRSNGFRSMVWPGKGGLEISIVEGRPAPAA